MTSAANTGRAAKAVSARHRQTDRQTDRENGSELKEARLTADGELTDGLWRNEVTEEGGKHDKDHGVGNPGEVLRRHVALKLPVDPLIG